MVTISRRDLTQAQIDDAQAVLARAKVRRINVMIELKKLETIIAENEAILDRARREQEARDKVVLKV